MPGRERARLQYATLPQRLPGVELVEVDGLHRELWHRHEAARACHHAAAAPWWQNVPAPHGSQHVQLVYVSCGLSAVSMVWLGFLFQDLWCRHQDAQAFCTNFSPIRWCCVWGSKCHKDVQRWVLSHRLQTCRMVIMDRMHAFLRSRFAHAPAPYPDASGMWRRRL